MRIRRYELSLLAYLTTLLSGVLLSSCGDPGIPVLVTIHAPGGSLFNTVVNAKLDGVAFAPVTPANPTNPFVIYLPSDSHGQLELSVKGLDAEKCISEGSKSIPVYPVGSEALRAVIEIDPEQYPKCVLKTTVLGNGSIHDRDQTFRCEGKGSETTCTHEFGKNKQVILVGEEGGIDQDLDAWEGACSCASPECALTLDRPLAVTATFQSRVCRPDGSCEAVQKGETPAPAAPIFSANAMWSANSKTLTYHYATLGSAKQVSVELSSPAYALWGTREMVWVFTQNREIWSCLADIRTPSVACTVGVRIADTHAEPATLLSYGGDEAGEFWAVDKRSIYRCHKGRYCDPPQPLSVAKIDSSSKGLPDKILTAFVRGEEVVIGGQSAKSCGASCDYFIRSSGKAGVEIINPEKPCLSASSIPLRLESGKESEIWARVSTSLYRLNGGSSSLVEKNIDPKSCFFFPEMVVRKKDGNGSPYVWLVGVGGRISRFPTTDISLCQKVLHDAGSTALRAVWLNNSDAWVVGDGATVLRCPLTGTGRCSLVSIKSRGDLVAVSGDAAGKVWAMSKDENLVLIVP